MMVGQFLSNQLCCGPLLLLVIRPEEEGAVKLLGLLTNAPCAIKSKIMIVVAGLQFKHCCLTEGKLVKIPNSQITQPRQVTSVLAPLTLQLHTHKFLDQGPLETKHQHNNLAFLQTTLFSSKE